MVRIGRKEVKHLYMVNVRYDSEEGIKVYKCVCFNCCETDKELVIGYKSNDQSKIMKIQKRWLVSPMMGLIESGCVFATTERGVLCTLEAIKEELGIIQDIIKGDLK